MIILCATLKKKRFASTTETTGRRERSMQEENTATRLASKQILREVFLYAAASLPLLSFDYFIHTDSAFKIY